jgi:PAS domain S-box-containing protein
MTTRRKNRKLGAAEARGESGSAARAKTVEPGAGTAAGADRRLQHLYEISKLLTRFESADSTVSAVIAILAETLALQSSIFILRRGGRYRTLVWKAAGVGGDRVLVAKARAQRSYAYLSGSGGTLPALFDGGEVANDSALPETVGTAERTSFVMLPLVVEQKPIFGALQLESAALRDEMDLMFVNAAVNQLAIALDRQTAIEARHAAAEAGRVEAEDRQIAAEAGRARAERMQEVAQGEQAEAEKKRDLAKAERETEERKRGAAEALRERYEALVDNLDHAFVWEADAQSYRMTYLSARAEMLLGYPRERWLGNADFWLTCVHPDDRGLVLDTFRRAVTDRKDQRCDHRFLTVEGHTVWFHTGIHLAGADTAAPQLQGVSVDITSGKAAANRILTQLNFIHTVTESLREGVIAIDLNGRVTLINPSAARMLACEEEPTLGRLIKDILQIRYPDGPVSTAQAWPFGFVVSSSDLLQTEEQVFSAPGRPPFPVSYSYAPLERDGRIAGAVLAFRDISERKQAERESIEAAERFRFLAESTPQKIFTARANGEIDYVNQQWVEFTGLESAKIEQFGWTALLHADDLDENERRWRHSIATGEPLQLEHRVRRADGAYCWHLTRARALRAVDGAVTMWIGSNTDIDDQKRAETEQRLLAEVGTIITASLDRRATFAAIARCVIPLIADLCVIDEVAEDGQIRRLEVVFADQQRERRFADRVRDFAPRPGWKTPQAQVIESGEPVLYPEIVDPAHDGVAQDAEHAAVMREVGVKSMLVLPLRSRGRRLGALTFVTAESGRRYGLRDLAVAEEFARRVATGIDNASLFEQAQRATRAREELLAIVSHDLKNPLNVILMSTSLMAPSPGTEDRRRSRDQIETIKRSARHMNRLIQDLLVTASIEAGKLRIESRQFPILPLVRDAIEAMRPVAARKFLTMTSELSGDIPDILADPGRVQQVFANLLGNAIKFTPVGGTITVRAEVVDREVRFSVADTGSGMAEDELLHLFERFWQARRTARHGTGLGLSIVKGIVDAHGGRIWVESGVGAGTTFFFTLPSAGHDANDVREAEVDETVGDEILRAEVLRAEVEKYSRELDELGDEGRKRELRTALDSTRVARELAEQATQFRREFVGLASEGLREPINELEQVIERLDTDTAPAPGQENVLRGILGSVARLTSVIESLLQHALLEGGRLTTHISSFDVLQVTREVIAELSPYAEKKAIDLRVTSSDAALITSDPDLVRLILLNLVGNAIKFTERGAVEASIDCTAQGCRLAVKDSGPGIPAGEGAGLFEPFVTAGDLLPQAIAGTGLGLMLVREIATALGGQVELESEMGRGSTFTVTLPSLPQLSPTPAR